MKKTTFIFYLLIVSLITVIFMTCSDPVVHDNPNRVINPQTTWDNARFDDENFKFN